VRNEWSRGDNPLLAAGWNAIRARVDRPAGHDVDWRAALDATGMFEPFRERSLPNPQRADLARLRRRWASISFIAALGPDERNALLDQAMAKVSEQAAR
jgi:hypothetical protein